MSARRQMRVGAALCLALTLLPWQTLSAEEPASGTLQREDIVRVDVIGRGRSVGRLLGVEGRVLQLGIGKKVAHIPVGNVMRVWRDDGGSGKAGNSTLGVVAGLGATCLVALAVPVDTSSEFTRDTISPRNDSAKRLLIGSLAGGATYWAVSSLVSGGQRRWTELPVSELAALDTRPPAEELAVDEEQLDSAGATEADKPAHAAGVAPTPAPVEELAVDEAQLDSAAPTPPPSGDEPKAE